MRMFRLKITPPAVLNMANTMMLECKRPTVFYCHRNAWSYKLWLDERNAFADQLMRQGIVG